MPFLSAIRSIGTEILLLDEAGDPTELYGEIGIRSAHVALGYLNQPELSKERFLARSEMIQPGGSIALATWPGSLPIAASNSPAARTIRSSCGGYRIELREIEAALAEHPAVRECAVALKGEMKINQAPHRLCRFCRNTMGTQSRADELSSKRGCPTI